MPELYLIPVGPDGREPDGAARVVIDRFPCVVGRGSACDRPVADPHVSRRHCAFEWRDGLVWVKDLGSRNGTQLNGEPVGAPRPVWDGDRLELAHLAFRVGLGLIAAAVALGTAAAISSL
jgi:S-DNA-T family DNA segregation ATPase FtsK/SpoIIIE